MHQRFTSLMSLHLDAAATQAEQIELSRHLRVCSTCADVWEEWQRVDRWLSMIPLIAPSHELVAKVLGRLEEEAPIRSDRSVPE